MVDATLLLLSVVILDVDGKILEWPEATAAPTGASIEECEAAVMSSGLNRSGSIIVIGGDNTGASRSFWKGYSLAASIQRWIDKEEEKARFAIFVDVPSVDNIADVKTRPDLGWTAQEIKRRRLASALRLQLA